MPDALAPFLCVSDIFRAARMKRKICRVCSSRNAVPLLLGLSDVGLEVENNLTTRGAVVQLVLFALAQEVGGGCPRIGPIRVPMLSFLMGWQQMSRHRARRIHGRSF